MLRLLLNWWGEQNGWLRFGVAAGFVLVTFVLQFGFGVFWPFGYVVGTLLAFLGMLSGK